MSPPSNINSKDGWDTWAKHVLAELERLSDCVGALQVEINSLRVDMATQRVKVGLVATVLGVVGGIVPVSIMILVELLTKKGP